MFAWNPVNRSLVFLVRFLWTGNFRAEIRAEALYNTGYNIAEFVAQLSTGPVENTPTTFRSKNQVENLKSELQYWVRPIVCPGQHPLSGCQGKDHVGTGSALLCSLLPVHGPSCSSIKSCLQTLLVSDCLHIPSSEIHLSIFLILFFTDTAIVFYWYLWSPQHPVPMRSRI